MIWKKCILHNDVKTSEDELGNALFERTPIKETKARRTPWTATEINLENRAVTKNEQFYLIPISFKNFPDCKYAEIDGIVQDIIETIDLSPRYTVIRVKVYKK